MIIEEKIKGGGSAIMPERIMVNPNLFVLFIICIIFSLASGYQWLGNSRDYIQYQDFYEGLSYGESLSNYRYEIGYTTLAWLFKFKLNASYNFFTFIIIFFALSIKFRLIQHYTTYPILACFAYLAIFYPTHEYTQVRAAVSIAFGYGSLIGLIEKKYFRSSVFAILGILCHYSSVILFFVFIVSRMFRIYPKLVIALLLIFSIILSFVYVYIFQIIYYLNPLSENYVIESIFYEKPNLFSVSNVLYFMTIMASVVVNRYWDDEIYTVSIIISIIGLFLFYILIDIPVFSHRIKEILLVSSIFFAFRFKGGGLHFAPMTIMLLNGAWMLYSAFSKGIIGF